MEEQALQFVTYYEKQIETALKILTEFVQPNEILSGTEKSLAIYYASVYDDVANRILPRKPSG